MVYTFTFTQGFILGQLTVVLLIGAFIRFFVFGELPPSETSSSRLTSTVPSSPSKRRRFLTSTTSSIHHRPRRRAVSFTSPASPSPSPSRRNSDSDSSLPKPRDRSRNRTSIHHILRPPPALTSETILSKTYYNVSSHQSESLDWFNVLIAQTIAQFRTDAARDNAILTSLTRVLNGVHKPSFLDEIRVTEIELGEYFPIFSNCRIVPVEDDDEDEVILPDKKRSKGKGRLQAQMDVDISDFITLGVETMIVLNYPRPRTAVLPVALSVSVVRFSGTLAISFSPATSTSSTTESGTQSRRTPTSLAFSFLPDYTLALSTRSLVGARSRLQDIPKIAQLVESRLRMWFEERCVLPRRQEVVVPSLWPSMKNVVDGEGKKPGQTPLMSAVAESEVEAVPDFRHDLDGGNEVRFRGEKKREGTSRPNSAGNANGTSGMLPGPLPGTLVT